MNRRLLNTRRTILCLLAAMLYQLGACRCVCMEHNAWVQTGVSLLAGSTDHWGRHHPAPLSATECGEADHCDLAESLAFVPGKRFSPRLLADSCQGVFITAAVHVANVRSDSLAAADAIRSLLERHHSSATLPVRSQLQVFRI
jgi:hypothetical protein